jgi:hypothetical protein
MDTGRLLQMILRLVMRKGMRFGMDYLARGGKDPAQMTPEERARMAKSRGIGQHLQKAQRITRMLRR